MKEASWEECLENSDAITITPDKAKAKALIETANERIDFLEKNAKTANPNFVFEGYYASLTELLHALVLREGLNVKNHVCLGFYLKDVLKREELFRLFDDCRYKRNGLLYYGKRMAPEIAKESIKKAKRLIEEIRIVLEGKKIGC